MASIEVMVAASPERAFDYLADPAHRPEWQSSLRAVADVRAPDGDPTAAGVTWTDVTVVPGLRPRLRTVVSERPRLWVEVGEWGPVLARLELRFTPVGSSTRLEAVVDVAGAGVGWLTTRAAVPAIRGDLRRAGRMLGHE